MPLSKPTITVGDIAALQNAKLDQWYAKNSDALYALTIALYDDVYKYQRIVVHVVPSHTIEEALRNFLNSYFSVGVSSVSHAKTTNNGYSKGLQDHFSYTQSLKNFNWQMYWAGLLPGQAGIDKLLETFYNFLINEAIDRGMETERTNATKLGQYEALVKAVNNLTQPLKTV